MAVWALLGAAAVLVASASSASGAAPMVGLLPRAVTADAAAARCEAALAAGGPCSVSATDVGQQVVQIELPSSVTAVTIILSAGAGGTPAGTTAGPGGGAGTVMAWTDSLTDLEGFGFQLGSAGSADGAGGGGWAAGGSGGQGGDAPGGGGGGASALFYRGQTLITVGGGGGGGAVTDPQQFGGGGGIGGLFAQGGFPSSGGAPGGAGGNQGGNDGQSAPVPGAGVAGAGGGGAGATGGSAASLGGGSGGGGGGGSSIADTSRFDVQYLTNHRGDGSILVIPSRPQVFDQCGTSTDGDAFAAGTRYAVMALGGGGTPGDPNDNARARAGRGGGYFVEFPGSGPLEGVEPRVVPGCQGQGGRGGTPSAGVGGAFSAVYEGSGSQALVVGGGGGGAGRDDSNLVGDGRIGGTGGDTGGIPRTASDPNGLPGEGDDGGDGGCAACATTAQEAVGGSSADNGVGGGGGYGLQDGAVLNGRGGAGGTGGRLGLGPGGGGGSGASSYGPGVTAELALLTNEDTDGGVVYLWSWPDGAGSLAPLPEAPPAPGAPGTEPARPPVLSPTG